MKAFFPILLVCTLALASVAQEARAGAASEQTSVTNKSLTFPVSAGVVSKPLVLTNDYISQPERTDLPEGGKAIYSFIITNAGNYTIRAVVNAPDEESNSFYINVDAQPEDPLTIWDIEVTTGFEERTVNWRGSGDASSGEFASKRFNLSAGVHKLIIMGREPGAQLKSISFRRVTE